MVCNQGLATPYFQTRRSLCLNWYLRTHAREFHRSVSKCSNPYISLISKTYINSAAFAIPIYRNSMCAISLVHFFAKLLVDDLGSFFQYATLCGVYNSDRTPAHPLLIFPFIVLAHGTLRYISSLMTTAATMSFNQCLYLPLECLLMCSYLFVHSSYAVCVNI